MCGHRRLQYLSEKEPRLACDRENNEERQIYSSADEHKRVLFNSASLEATADQIERTLKPERIVVVCNSAAGNKPEIIYQRGLTDNVKLGAAEISLSTIKAVLKDGKSASIIDTGTQGNQDITESVFVCGLNSVVCAPIQNKSGSPIGVLYADDRRQPGRFLQQHADWLSQVGRALGSKIKEPEANAESKEESVSNLEKEDIWRDMYIQGIQARQKRCYKDSLKTLTKALTYCKYRNLNGLPLASTLNAIAEVQRLQGDLEAAETKIRECLEVVKSDNVKELDSIVKFHNNLAGIKYAQQNIQEASSIYQQILLKLNEEGMSDSHLGVPIFSNLGTLKIMQNQTLLAASFFKKAHALAMAHWGAEDPRTKRCQEKLKSLPNS